MKFMNMWKFGAANGYFDKADDGQGGGGGGGDEPEPISFKSQVELDAYIEKMSKSKNGKDDDEEEESLYEKRQKQKQQDEDKKQNLAKLQQATRFDLQFDGFINDNSKFFPDSVKTVRSDIDSDDDVERSNLMAATAAKEFFSKKENLEILSKSDREQAEREVLGVRFESKIDGQKAWALVERAIHGHGISDKTRQTNNFYGKKEGKTGFNNLDKAIDSFYPGSVVSREA